MSTTPCSQRELAVGWALHALEPEEEARVAAHLPQCPECRERVAQTERTAALSLYLAMMTATCLELIGAKGPTLVEGPFARNALYAAMLGAATARPVLLPAPGSTGTAATSTTQ